MEHLTELSCAVLTRRSTAWLGFSVELCPGLFDALSWLPWLGLCMNSWWLEWALNPEECSAAKKGKKNKEIMLYIFYFFLKASRKKNRELRSLQGQWASSTKMLSRGSRWINVWKERVWMFCVCLLCVWNCVWDCDVSPDALLCQSWTVVTLPAVKWTHPS